MDVLPHLTGVDAVVTDPPFGVRTDEAWDDMDRQEFCRFSMQWLSIARLLTPNLSSFYAIPEFFRLCELIYPRVRQFIWNKPLGSQYAGSSDTGLWYAHEPIAHCWEEDAKCLAVADAIRIAREEAGIARGAIDVALRGKKTGLCYRWEEAACLPTPEQAKKLAKLIPLSREFWEHLDVAYSRRKEGAKASDVFTHRTVTEGVHSCEKPVELISDVLLASSGTVCDPFMGSGSCGVASVLVGRPFIGIEQDPKHFETAKRRIQDSLGMETKRPDGTIQKRMFAEL